MNFQLSAKGRYVDEICHVSVVGGLFCEEPTDSPLGLGIGAAERLTDKKTNELVKTNRVWLSEM